MTRRLARLASWAAIAVLVALANAIEPASATTVDWSDSGTFYYGTQSVPAGTSIPAPTGDHFVAVYYGSAEGGILVSQAYYDTLADPTGYTTGPLVVGTNPVCASCAVSIIDEGPYDGTGAPTSTSSADYAPFVSTLSAFFDPLTGTPAADPNGQGLADATTFVLHVLVPGVAALVFAALLFWLGVKWLRRGVDSEGPWEGVRLTPAARAWRNGG